MENLNERLVDCFARVFRELDRADIPKASMDSVGDWDSLGSLMLHTEVEEEFGIRMSLDEFDRLQSYEAILHFLDWQSLSPGN
jgi:acyl carrier protein